MKIQEQLKNLKALNLPKDEFIVVSSGALAVRGIRDANDLDVIVTQSLWDILSKKYTVELSDSGVERISPSNDIEILSPKQSIFGNSKNIPFEKIFEEADIFDEMRFINLEQLKKIKTALGREKDLNDVKLIDKYLETNRKS